MNTVITPRAGNKRMESRRKLAGMMRRIYYPYYQHFACLDGRNGRYINVSSRMVERLICRPIKEPKW